MTVHLLPPKKEVKLLPKAKELTDEELKEYALALAKRMSANVMGFTYEDNRLHIVYWKKQYYLM